MAITKCPHVNRKHYAKNMCSSCYRKFGRNQYATNCEHTDRLLYSMGMCQTCYLSDYHKRRTKVKRKAQQMEARAAKEAAICDSNQSCGSISTELIKKINDEIKEDEEE